MRSSTLEPVVEQAVFYDHMSERLGTNPEPPVCVKVHPVMWMFSCLMLLFPARPSGLIHMP